MRITCPSCAAQYDVEENDISASGQEVQCSDCETVWMQERDGSVRSSPTGTPEQPDVAPTPDAPVVIDFPDPQPEPAVQEPDTFQPQSLAELEAEIASESAVDQATSETVVDIESPPQDAAFQPESLAESETENADEDEISETQNDIQPEEAPVDEPFQPRSLAELEAEIAMENAEPDVPDQDEPAEEPPTQTDIQDEIQVVEPVAEEPAFDEPIVEDSQADDLLPPEEPLDDLKDADAISEFSTPPISGFDPSEIEKEAPPQDYDDPDVEEETQDTNDEPLVATEDTADISALIEDEDISQNDDVEVPDEIIEDHTDEPVAQDAPEADHPDKTSEPALEIVAEPAQEELETEVFRPKSLAEIQAEIAAAIPEDIVVEPELSVPVEDDVQKDEPGEVFQPKSLTELEAEITAQTPAETDVADDSTDEIDTDVVAEPYPEPQVETVDVFEDEPPATVPFTPASDVVDETPDISDIQPSGTVDTQPDLEQPTPEDDDLDLSEFFTTAPTPIAAMAAAPEQKTVQTTAPEEPEVSEDEFDDNALLATFREQVAAEDKIDGVEPSNPSIDLVPEELIGRRARMPNIDALKQSVRTRKVKLDPEELKRIKTKRGFKIGFIFSLSLITLIVFVYLGSNMIATYIPSIAPYVEGFASVMDILRDRFSAAGTFIRSFFAQFL